VSEDRYGVSKTLKRARELAVGEAPGNDRQDYTANDVWNLALEVVRLTNANRKLRKSANLTPPAPGPPPPSARPPADEV
jgi:hypothetical protein